MSKEKLRQIKQLVKEKELAKIRWQWFKTYKKLKNVSKVCRMYGISRSQFYYWKKRLDLPSSSGKRQTSKANRLIAYSRKPKTNPREYPEETVKLIDETAKRMNKKYRWVYQYTAIDIATGIKLKIIYETHDSRASVDFLTKVRLFYPFPVQIIQTDNGFEFTWKLHPEIQKIHPFTIQCQLFGYEHYLIPPAYPQSNSHVERTHRIDEEEVYRGRTFTSLKKLHKVNLQSLKYFNEKRPQKSKHFNPPLKFGILKYQLKSQKLNYTVLNV